MPIDYRIDPERRIVWVEGRGTVTDADVFGYQQDVWSRSEVSGYDELVDMTAVDHIALPSADRVQELARLSAGMDSRGPSRLAVVAPSDAAFGIGRMYQTHRELDPRSTKEVGVFRTRAEALAFLGIEDPERA